MKKQKLINLIDRALRIEEDVGAGLSEDLSATVNWSSFTEKEKDEVNRILKKLHDDTIRHAKIISALKERILKDTRNVY